MDIFKCHGCKYKFLLKKKEKRGIAQLLSFYERQLQTILQEYSERMFLFHKSFDQQVLNDCLSSGTVQNPEGPFGSKPSQLPQDLRCQHTLIMSAKPVQDNYRGNTFAKPTVYFLKLPIVIDSRASYLVTPNLEDLWDLLSHAQLQSSTD
jgi:hypothetical protein